MTAGPAELDLARTAVVFISFDEPNAEENFERLRAIVPGAERVHGVRGFDAAHRAAGDLARTPHVVTIDGDNVVLEPGFFGLRLTLPARELSRVISFGARVVHNGLLYGNGGAKIWPRALLRNLRAHAGGTGDQPGVDFCWRVPYVQAIGAPTATEVTRSAAQAFRAGLREGVRLTMDQGRPLFRAHSGLIPAEAVRRLPDRHLERLRVWCSVGRDVENGDWAILGARLGCVWALLDELDISRINDFDWIDDLWSTIYPDHADPAMRQAAIGRLGERIGNELELEVVDLPPDASRFNKSVYRPPRRLGTLLPLSTARQWADRAAVERSDACDPLVASGTAEG